ncbi:MAG: aromatic ring-hydroxylating dioxygenase subunit alpha [Hyphomicrobiaceae bacterium]
MDRAGEIKLLKKLLNYIDTGTTAMAPAPWQNPVTAYTCPERHKAEEKILIRGRPIVMGFSCDWPKPGTWRTDDYAGVPILTVRGSDGKLRAFLNVCRHRGAKVADGCGHSATFTCPYHGWTYGNDGRLRGLPEEATAFPDVRQDRSGLTPLPLAEKYGMVWVLPTPGKGDGAAADLDIEPWLQGMGPDLAHWKLDTYHFHAKHVQHEEMNWKILVDTFHESYHFGFLHKTSLDGILVHNVSDFEPFGENFRLTYGRPKLERLPKTPESEWDLMWNTAIVYSLFANTVLVPQGDHMELFRIFPVAGRPDRALMETTLYIPKPVANEEERRHWDANLELAVKVITTEDFPAGRSMQIGFGSGAQTHTIYGRNELGLMHYHQAVRRALGLPLDTFPTVESQAAE